MDTLLLNHMLKVMIWTLGGTSFHPEPWGNFKEEIFSGQGQ